MRSCCSRPHRRRPPGWRSPRGRSARRIPHTGRALLVRKVVVGSWQRARITVKAPKKVRVLKTATTVEVRTRHAPKRAGRVGITASGPRVTDTTWTRRWRLR